MTTNKLSVNVINFQEKRIEKTYSNKSNEVSDVIAEEKAYQKKPVVERP
jgi:hypothetical protein